MKLRRLSSNLPVKRLKFYNRHLYAVVAQRSVRRPFKADTRVRIPSPVKTVGANLYKETHLGKQGRTAAGGVVRLTNLMGTPIWGLRLRATVCLRSYRYTKTAFKFILRGHGA